ncbi:hypothetical protein CVT24_011339 [Panaeolus cyanescens]|uniref:Uncharacterized protein n=1 Tax=Panaeolus cyanescens TaxID=181874 RepID=A0A409WE59_9AGAR|nr:hypothetical protein CVT24_011339 [Panaeolus cyanescens]
MEFQNINILAARNPDKPLTGIDGLVAVHLAHQGRHYVISSPNQKHVPLPPIGRRKVGLKANFRYGLEDHCQWPQFVVPKYKHLPTIPRKTTDPTDPLHIIWWDPRPADFIPSSTGIISGLGTISQSRLQQLETAMGILSKSVTEFTTSTPTPSDKALESFSELQKQMEYAMRSLQNLKRSFRETSFNVTEFQRRFLDLHGFLSFMKTFRHRSGGALATSYSADNVMGGFTHNAEMAQAMFNARVPVWYVEEWDGSPFLRNVLAVVDITMPNLSIVMSDHDPPFLHVFEGEMTSEERYGFIYTYAAERVISGDPFSSGISSSPTNSSAVTSSSSRRRQPVETGRSHFKPLDSPYTPYTIPAWITALEAVHNSQANIADTRGIGTHGQYILPDPGLFIGSPHMQRHLKTFLQIRHAWFSAISYGGSPLLSHEWLLLLNMDVTKPPPTGNTKTAQQQRSVWEKLRLKSNVLNQGVTIDPHSFGDPDWNGQYYPGDTEIPTSVVRDIFWWIYEQNFTHELIALDLRLSSNIHRDRRRQSPDILHSREMEFIAPCFGCSPTSFFKHPDITDQNLGLAANEIQGRLPHIVSLAKVMKSWTGQPIPDIILKYCDRRNPKSIPIDNAAQLENAVAQFYCQCFWNQFSRAPQIPHRLNKPE